MLLLVVLALAGGMTLAGKAEQNGARSGRTGRTPRGAAAVQIAIRPRPLPVEVRGVHVTGALASLPGKLEEYMALTKHGLNTIELDIKDEGGEIAFAPDRVAARAEGGSGRELLRPAQVARLDASQGRLPDRPRRRLPGSVSRRRARPTSPCGARDGVDLDDERRARLGQPVRPAGLGLRRHGRGVRPRARASTRSCSTTCASRPTATSRRRVSGEDERAERAS